jgi:hypothetical protein
MPASVSNERIVERQASSVNSVPPRRSSTRALGSVGGASVWISAQQRSNRVVRISDGTFSVVRSAVQRADTNRTNCKSGIPEFWISNDGMAEHYQWRPARSQRAQYPRRLTHIIHERLCYNHQSAATTSLRPAGSLLGPLPYCWGLAPFFLAPVPSLGQDRHRRRRWSQSPGLRAPVSRRGSAISRRAVMNNTG